MQCTHFSSLELGICAISCTDHTAYFDNGCHQRTKIYFPGSLPFSTPDLGDELQPRWCYFPLKKEVDMRFANFSLKSLEQFWSGANPCKVQYLQSCKVFDRCFNKILQDSKKSYVNTKTRSCSKYINSHDGTEKTFACTTDLIESSKSVEDDCNSSCNGSDTKHKAQRHNQGKRKASRHENAWGGPTYTELITKAILSAPEQRLTLSQIYDWLAENVKYFRERSNYNSSQGWKVSWLMTINIIFLFSCRKYI